MKSTMRSFLFFSLIFSLAILSSCTTVELESFKHPNPLDDIMVPFQYKVAFGSANTTVLGPQIARVLVEFNSSDMMMCDGTYTTVTPNGSTTQNCNQTATGPFLMEDLRTEGMITRIGEQINLTNITRSEEANQTCYVYRRGASGMAAMCTKDNLLTHYFEKNDFGRGRLLWKLAGFPFPEAAVESVFEENASTFVSSFLG
jgi:hypothetical protein